MDREGEAQAMTNRERAKELDNQIMLNGRLRQGDRSVGLIERALDEAHKEGTELGYDMGQREMRERAAKVCVDLYNETTYAKCSEAEAQIRALPIEGEIPEENKKMGCNHPGDICEA